MPFSPALRIIATFLLVSNLFTNIIPSRPSRALSPTPSPTPATIYPVPTDHPELPQEQAQTSVTIDTISQNWGKTTLVRVYGSYAYAAVNGGWDLQIFNVSNPANPTPVYLFKQLADNDRIYDIAFSGSRAYLLLQSQEIKILDISNPASPNLVITRRFMLPCDWSCYNQPTDIEISGHYIYLVSKASAGYTPAYLTVIDLDNLGDQWLFTPPSIEVPQAHRIRISGSYAFVVGDGPIYVFNISVPASPQLAATYDPASFGLPNQRFGLLAISGRYLYVAMQERGVSTLFGVFDIQNIGSPSLMETIPINSLDQWEDLVIYGDLILSGTKAYILHTETNNGLSVMDISNPASPQVSATDQVISLGAASMDVTGSRVYIANTTQGLITADFTNPAQPVLTGRYLIPGNVQHVVTRGNYAYLTQPDYGLDIADISDHTAPRVVGSLQMPVTVLAISGNYVYINEDPSYWLQGGSNERGFYIVDISDPTAPVLRGHDQSGSSCNPANYYPNIAAVGSLVFSAVCGTINLVDVSNPDQPVKISQVYGSDFTLVDSYLYSLDNYYLYVTDVSDPLHPIAYPQINVPYGGGLAANGDFLYLIDRQTSADPKMQYVMDITDRAHPQLINTITLPQVFPPHIENKYKIFNNVLFGMYQDRWYVNGYTSMYTLDDPTTPNDTENRLTFYDIAAAGSDLVLANYGIQFIHLNYTQTTGNISGHVTKADGSALAGATVLAVPEGQTTLAASPASVAADNTATARIILAGGAPGHQVRLVSGRGSPLDTIQPAYGAIDANGIFSATIRSNTPGGTIITARDITANRDLGSSVRVDFTGGAVQPPPPGSGDVTITEVKSRYPLDGRYLQGFAEKALTAVLNPITVTIDWHGQAPGRVDFILNNKPYPEYPTGSTASHTFDMELDLQPGENYLRIQAVNQNGSTSTRDYAPFLVPAPEWLMAFSQSPLALLTLAGSTDASFESKTGVKIPPDGLNLGATKFGGEDLKFSLAINGGVKIPVSCAKPVEVKASGGWDMNFKFAGVKFGGGPTFTGKVTTQTYSCKIETATGSLKVEFKLYGEKDWPVLTFIINFVSPGAGDTVQALLPDWITGVLGNVYLQGNIQGYFQSDLSLITSQPYLNYKKMTFGGGPGFEAGYKYEFWEGEIKAYFGGKGQMNFALEAPIYNLNNLHFSHISLDGEAGVKVRAAWFTTDDKVTVTWRYPAENSSPADQPAQASGPVMRLIGHYANSANPMQFHGSRLEPQALAAPGAKLAAQLAQNASSRVASLTASTPLVANVYPYAEPAFAMNPDTGKAILVWVQESAVKPVGQAHDLYYSLWDGAAWSTPAPVTDDLFLDGYPQVAWDAQGKAVLVWERIPSLLAPDAVWGTQTASQIEIASAVFDPAAGQWSAPQLLTNNQVVDMRPTLARSSDGSLLLAWRENAGNLLYSSAAYPDQIWTARYTSGWQAASALTLSLANLESFALAYQNGQAVLVYTTHTIDPVTKTDTQHVHLTSFDGSAWGSPAELPALPGAFTSAQPFYHGNGQPKMIGVSSGCLELVDLTNYTRQEDCPAETLGGIDRFRFFQGASGNIAVVFTAQAGQRDIYLAVYDQVNQVWGKPARLTDDLRSESYINAGLNTNGDLLAVYTADSAEGQTDLMTLAHTFHQNLTLGPGDLTVSQPVNQDGAFTQLVARVHNTGDLGVQSVKVAFYRGDPAQGGVLLGSQESWPGSVLPAGQTLELAYQIQFHSADGAQTFYAVVDPDAALLESNETDNQTSLYTFLPDLAIDEAFVEYWGGRQVGLYDVVSNQGVTPSAPATLTWKLNDADGQVIGTQDIPAMLPGESLTVISPWETSAIQEGEQALFASIGSGQAESSLDNNHISTTLLVGPDIQISSDYLWVDTTNLKQPHVKVQVSNNGPVDAQNVRLDLFDNPNLANTVPVKTLSIASLPSGSSTRVEVDLAKSLACGLVARVSASAAQNDINRQNNLASWGDMSGVCLTYRTWLPILRNKPLSSGPSISQSHTMAAGQAAVSVVTDGNGNYQFSQLPAGAYRVMVIYQGQVFNPAVQVVTIPPSASGVNFTQPVSASPGAAGESLPAPRFIIQAAQEFSFEQ